MTETQDLPDPQTKKIHPFFSAPKPAAPSLKSENAVTPPTPDPSCSPASDRSIAEPSREDQDNDAITERKRKRRKTDAEAVSSEGPTRAPRSKRSTRVSTSANIIAHLEQQDAPSHDGVEDTSSHSHSKELALADKAGLDEPGAKRLQLAEEKQTPRRVLRLNTKTGTIGSPPRPKSSPAVPASNPPKRGRPPRKQLVSISYDVDEKKHIGERIDQILQGTLQFSLKVLESTISSKSQVPTCQKPTQSAGAETAVPPKKPATPKKRSHPFFQTKGKPQPPTVEPQQEPTKETKTSPQRRQVLFTSTPCSPKRPKSTGPIYSGPTLASKNGLLRTPGAKHPAWPWSGTVHVRDNITTSDQQQYTNPGVVARKRARKAKRQAIQVNMDEDIIKEASTDLGVDELVDSLKSMCSEDFAPISPVVRVPVKHFESGQTLQQRVRKELRTLKTDGSPSNTHPAILHTYNNIASTLSAFDRATCESTAWAQKYAPTSAQCVLQSGREAELLREWLQALKIQAVDTGASDSSKPKTTAPSRKKRRRKQLDDFVVSSDEESDGMDELSDHETDWMTPGGRSGTQKTVLRTGDIAKGGKSSAPPANAALLSGPHGCGKTAAIYAVAKELDFEVFELHAGARRNGKDILEKVGNMTQNHIVSHQQKEDGNTNSIDDDATERDVKSGRQGTMDSWFKPKKAAAKKEPKKPTAQAAKPKLAIIESKKPTRDQKQSLILLEEVDILFEEDKQFWATVISMIAQSKRPFIMTCNDETVVPKQLLKLHGIFRFSPPPTDLAVDLLLSISANEGHALRRGAIETLYESRGHDLRASITELNYWCQIGVGNVRGGVDWFFPRWPIGCDEDKEGNVIRVVSQDTYHVGMGWLNRDSIATKAQSRPVAEELHRQAWDYWGLDILDPSESKDFERWAQEATEEATSNDARFALLESMDTFSELMSDSDMCGSFLPVHSSRNALDTTAPPMHHKSLDDYTIGHRVLDAPSACVYDSLAQDVCSSMRNFAQTWLQTRQPVPSQRRPLGSLTEKRVVSDIKYHVKHAEEQEVPISRLDYSRAFDGIAASDKVIANGYLDLSVFDRPMTPIALDVAPYVRSIVSYDQRLQDERRMRSSLLSEGGQPEKKRVRTTRAAFSALEGGSRASTRREKYFGSADVNPHLVLQTGGKGWAELGHQVGVMAAASDACHFQGSVDIDGDSEMS